MEFLIERAPNLLDMLDSRGSSPLEVAALRGREEKVSWLLDKGCKLQNTQNLMLGASKVYLNLLSENILTSIILFLSPGKFHIEKLIKRLLVEEPDLINKPTRKHTLTPQPPIWHRLSRLSSSTIERLDFLVSQGADVKRWEDTLWAALPQNEPGPENYRKQVVAWMLDAGVPVTERVMQTALEEWRGSDAEHAVEAILLISDALKIAWTTKEARDMFYPFLAKSVIIVQLIDAFVPDVNATFG
jgi:hypothetical protein